MFSLEILSVIREENNMFPLLNSLIIEMLSFYLLTSIIYLIKNKHLLMKLIWWLFSFKILWIFNKLFDNCFYSELWASYLFNWSNSCFNYNLKEDLLKNDQLAESKYQDELVICWTSQQFEEENDDLKTEQMNSKELSKRQDVVNKISLRHLRKYYLNIFKAKNLRIVRSRFCNVKSSDIMQAIKRTFESEFSNMQEPKDLYYICFLIFFKNVIFISKIY